MARRSDCAGPPQKVVAVPDYLGETVRVRRTSGVRDSGGVGLKMGVSIEKETASNQRADGIADDFIRRAEARDLTVCVIGLGYVGLPLAEGFLNRGFRVLGFDVDHSKIDAIMAGRTYIKHIPDDRIVTMRDCGKLEVTTDPARLAQADALLMCVPTPLNIYREIGRAHV